jgi:hypothetical protein
VGIAGVNDLFPFLTVDMFHHWARVQGEAAINAAVSQPFDPSILEASRHGVAFLTRVWKITKG